jgi:Intein/homing endonuclease
MLSCSDFAKHALKLELYPKQAEILNSFFSGGYTQATWALGRRCVTGDTLVPTRRGMLEIGSLRGLGAPVRTIDGDGWSSLGLDVAQPHGGAANAALFYDGGVQKIKRLRTALGIELRGTPNHPIMTLGEHGEYCWKSLENIKPGDPVVLQAGGNVWSQKEPSTASIEYVRLGGGSIKPPASPPHKLCFIVYPLMSSGTGILSMLS